MKKVVKPTDDISNAVEEAMRRHYERVMTLYKETGSITRTAYHLKLDEQTIVAIIDKLNGVSE